MEKIQYKDSLRKDIKTVKKRERKWDIILIRLLSEALAIVLSLPIFIGFEKLTKLEINWVASLTTLFILDAITAVRGIKKDLEERKDKVSYAEGNIRALAHTINLENEDAINLTPKITFENFLDTVMTKEEEKYNENIVSDLDDKEHIKKTKISTTNFFLLDTSDKLRVLKEVRTEIKEQGNTDVDEELYLLDNDDIPSYVPVVRKLERK